MAFLAAAFFLVWAASISHARIGGGHRYKSRSSSRRSTRGSSSYSRKSSSRSSGYSRKSTSRSSGYSSRRSSGGGASIASADPEAIKIALGLMVLIAIPILLSMYGGRLKKILSSFSHRIEMEPPLDSLSIDEKVAEMQQTNPNFSLPMFMDVAQKIYTLGHTYGGKNKLGDVSSYITFLARKELEEAYKSRTNTRDMVIGTMYIIDIEVGKHHHKIKLGIESNYTVSTSARDISYYEYAVWNFQYDLADLYSDQADSKKLACYHCGAPIDDKTLDKCAYCGGDVDSNYTGWHVGFIPRMNRLSRKQEISLAHYELEKGTAAPTIFHPKLQERLQKYKGVDPDFDMTTFENHVKHVFLSLQNAWSKLDWEKARPLETDNLFHNHLYWINRYKEERIRNVLENIRILKIELVKIMSDKYYHAFTVRIKADMKDYTVTYKGKILGGDLKRPRPFTEYWTFIRRDGAEQRTTPEKQCPNCGNSLKVGMMGKCEHCGTKLTSGEFGWVLSMIQQDESYTG